MATKKQMMRIDLMKGDHPDDLVTGAIPEIKRRLDALVARAPEYADEIRIEIEAYEYYGSTRMSLDAYYYREENAEERKKRLDEDKARQDGLRDRELDMLRKLKEKYPDEA
jgi:hypothetical protein